MLAPRGRTAAAIGALLIAVLVSGCDEDDGPNSAPPSDSPSVPESSTPTEPTTTPTETGPVEPTLSSGIDETKDGARTFVEFYWETVSFAQATGDVDLLKSLSIPSCAGCNAGIESIEKVYRRGGRILGGRFSILDAIPRQTSGGAWNVSADVRVGRRKVVGAGSLNETSKPGTVNFLFGLDFHRGAWSVTFLDVA